MFQDGEKEGCGDWVMWDQEKAVRRADRRLGPRRGVEQRSDVENRGKPGLVEGLTRCKYSWICGINDCFTCESGRWEEGRMLAVLSL